MELKPGLIHLQKAIAMGKTDMDGDDDYGVDKAFGKGRKIHGGEEVSRKKHLKDGARGLGHLMKHAEHGPHEMACPKDGGQTGSEPKNVA